MDNGIKDIYRLMTNNNRDIVDAPLKKIRNSYLLTIKQIDYLEGMCLASVVLHAQ